MRGAQTPVLSLTCCLTSAMIPWWQLAMCPDPNCFVEDLGLLPFTRGHLQCNFKGAALMHEGVHGSLLPQLAWSIHVRSLTIDFVISQSSLICDLRICPCCWLALATIVSNCCSTSWGSRPPCFAAARACCCLSAAAALLASFDVGCMPV